MGPIFGGFMSETIGFSQSATVMGLCALLMGIICVLTGINFKEFKHSPKQKSTKRKMTLKKIPLRTISNKDNEFKIRRFTVNETSPLLV